MARPMLPEPPDELKAHSRRLSQRMREIAGPDQLLTFSQFMEMALYEPGMGYYSAGLDRFGAAGDFVTAPELGSVFGACLANQAAEIAGLVGEYDIVEIGAGTGRLAAVVLEELKPEAMPRRYRIFERSADLRRAQQAMLDERAPRWRDRVEWLDTPPKKGWTGLLIANEVIDALAVERFRVEGGRVEQLCVDTRTMPFRWCSRPAPERLEDAVRDVETALGRNFPDGYRSEILPELPAWLRSLTESLEVGLGLFVDYGYPRQEFYLPARNDGTLMCHYHHRAHNDPFFWPGLQDLTAWVDFTALAEAALDCGLEVEGYATQAMFLLGNGLDRIVSECTAASDDEGLALAAEVKQLTLPGQMGERFQVMGLGRGLDTPPLGFNLQDLRHRL